MKNSFNIIFIKFKKLNTNLLDFSFIFQYICIMKTKADILWSVIRWRRIFNVLLFLLLCVVAKAQVYTDTLNVTVYFPCGSSNIAVNPNNTLSLGQFIHQLDSVGQMYVITPISLSLTSSASPEGCGSLQGETS